MLPALPCTHAPRGYTPPTLRVLESFTMTKSRYRFLQDDPAPYFITATTVKWLPLFNNPQIAGILIDSLRFLVSSQRLHIYAYVIMENHLHLVAAADNLSKEIANFKSFTARKSIDTYLERNNQFILRQLVIYIMDHKTDRPYQFWQEGSHPQRISDQAMVQQKVEYIHHNPVRRGFVDLPEHWRYSSARNATGLGR